MNTKKEKLKIEDISLKQSEKGDFYKLKLGGRSFSCFKDVTGFQQLQNHNVKVNDSVEVEFTESQGNYNGSPIIYRNIKSFDLLSKIEEPATKVEFKNVPDLRERRIARMNCMTNALAFMNLNKEFIMKEMEKSSMKDISLDFVIGVARRIENEYIYQEKE